MPGYDDLFEKATQKLDSVANAQNKAVKYREKEDNYQSPYDDLLPDRDIDESQLSDEAKQQVNQIRLQTEKERKDWQEYEDLPLTKRWGRSWKGNIKGQKSDIKYAAAEAFRDGNYIDAAGNMAKLAVDPLRGINAKIAEIFGADEKVVETLKKASNPVSLIAQVGIDKIREKSEDFNNEQYQKLIESSKRDAAESEELLRGAHGFVHDVASVAPQVAELAGVITLSAVAPPLGGAASTAYLSKMGVTTYGGGLRQYDEYAKSKGRDPHEKEWVRQGVGLANAASEVLAERFLGGISRYLPKIVKTGLGQHFVNKLMKSKVGQESFERAARKFASEQPKAWEKLTKAALMQGQRAGAEGIEETVTEVAQHFIHNYYMDELDKQGGAELLQNSWQAFKGGGLMGLMLGPVAGGASKYTRNKIRNNEGIAIALSKDGQAFEVLGEKDGKIIGQTRKGAQVEVSPEDIVDQAYMTNQELKEYVAGQQQAIDQSVFEQAASVRNNQTGNIELVWTKMQDENAVPYSLIETNGRDAVVVDNETGERKIIPHDNISKRSTIPFQDYLKIKTEEINQAIEESASDSPAQEKPQVDLTPGNTIEVNGQIGNISEISTDGTVILDTEQGTVAISPEQIQSARPATIIELDAETQVPAIQTENGLEIQEEFIDKEKAELLTTRLNELFQGKRVFEMIPFDNENPNQPNKIKIIGRQYEAEPAPGIEQQEQYQKQEGELQQDQQPVTNEVEAQEQDQIQKPEPKVISDGKNEYQVTQAGDNIYQVGDVFNSQKEAETVRKRLEGVLGNKVKFEIEQQDSGDPFIPDRYRILATPIQKEQEQNQQVNENKQAEPDTPIYSMNGRPVSRGMAKLAIKKAQKPEDIEGLSVQGDEELQKMIADKFPDPEYYFEGDPLTREEVAAVIENAQSIEDLEGIEIKNDPELESLIQEKFAPKQENEVEPEPVEAGAVVKENLKTEKQEQNAGEYLENVIQNKDLEEAGKDVEKNPTEAQKEAGNYKKGHVKIQGLDITIENPKGSERSGTDEIGNKWSQTLNNHYGYFKRTEGKDGDQVDVFVGEKPASKKVFVVDQISPVTGEFDEHKVMMGFETIDEASDAYFSNYEEGWQGLGAITEMTIDEFKDWLKNGDTTKPIAYYNPYDQPGVEAGTKSYSNLGTASVSKNHKERRKKVLSREPESLQEHILQFFLSGGRIKTDDFIRFTGYKRGSKEFKSFLWALKNDGIALDRFMDIGTGSWNDFGMADAAAMDVENAVIDALLTYGTPTRMAIKLEEMQQAKDFEFNNALLPKNLNNNEEINKFNDVITEFTDKEGNVDYEKIFNKIEDDPEFFTIYPFGLSKEELEQLKQEVNERRQNDTGTEAQGDKGNNKAEGEGSEQKPVQGSQRDGDSSAKANTPPEEGQQRRDREIKEPETGKSGQPKQEPKLTPGQQAELDKQLEQIDQKIKEQRERLSNARKEQDRQWNKLNLRKGLDGNDTSGQDSGLFAGQFIANKETMKKAIRPYDERVNAAETELKRLQRLRQGIIDNAGKQGDLYSDNQNQTSKKPVKKNKPLKKSNYGTKNKIVSKDRYEELKRKMREKGNNLNAGIDPEMVAMGAEMAAYHIEAGARKFKDFAQNMINDLGEWVKPYLKSFYSSARYYPGMEEYSPEMDGDSEVQNFDLETIKPQDDAEYEPRNIEQDSPGGKNENNIDGTNVPNTPGENRGERGEGNINDREGNKETPEYNNEAAENGINDLGGATPINREGGDNGLRGENKGRKSSGDATGNNKSGRSSYFNSKRKTQPDRERDVRNGVRDRNADGTPSPIRRGNLEDIQKTLPELFPEQQEDVLRAEKRFFTGENTGKGKLFTNGTGTGKTYTGLGIAKRFILDGKTNILIVVPTDAKAKDWIEEGTNLNVSLTQLRDTKDNGGDGPIVTTYANFYQNEAINNREFDLIIYDEAHYMGQNQAGEATKVFDKHRFVANLPSAARTKAELIAGERPLQPNEPRLNDTPEVEKQWEQYDNNLKAWNDRYEKAFRELVDKTKVVFLSATPFAYHKSLAWGDGTLFEISEGLETRDDRYLGYNEAGGFNKFLIENLGYRMRYNKATIPESGVDVSLLERQLFEKFVKEGVFTGRQLKIDKDYSREFIDVGTEIGEKINEGMKKFSMLNKEFAQKYPVLTKRAHKKWNYLYMNQLMEGIKAHNSVERIQQHLDMGRKVVVFHGYNHALPSHPFRFSVEELFSPGEMADPRNVSAMAKAESEIEEFESEYPQYANLDLSELSNPRRELSKAFGDRMREFNGTIPKKKRFGYIAEFNDENSGVDLLVVQRKAGKEGISLHDKNGKKQRVLIDLGLPTAPTDAIQCEGRIYRLGVQSNAIFEYPIINTDFERMAFAMKVAERSKTAENFAM